MSLASSTASNSRTTPASQFKPLGGAAEPPGSPSPENGEGSLSTRSSSKGLSALDSAAVRGASQNSRDALRAFDPCKWAWLVAFVGTGIGLGLNFEFLSIHAGPARYDTFFLCLLGYWANFLTGLFWVVGSGSWRRHGVVWTRPMLGALFGAAVFDGGAQALNFVAQVEGGIMLFTIFQSSVTLFACMIAVCLVGARLKPMQWFGVGSIVFGLMLTSIPKPLVARHSFFWGFSSAMVASLLLATSYPLSELVFRLAPAAPPSPEMACLAGSVVNVVAITTWTIVYTLPRWDEAIIEPIINAPFPSVSLAIIGYALFGLQVGIHSLAYWKSIAGLGTVQTAVSKGVQQGGNFLFLHFFFCGVDTSECIYNNGLGEQTMWNHMQKPLAFLCCCGGVFIYSLGKEKAAPLAERDEVEGAELEEARFEARESARAVSPRAGEL